jgi:ligand-binding sensor domain-containing protein
MGTRADLMPPSGRPDPTRTRPRPLRRPRHPRRLSLALVSACALKLMAAAAWGSGPESLDQRYQHRSWHLGDGLPGISIYALAQAADHYLWVGTDNGLARFDGKHFRIYGNASGKAPHSHVVRALLAARDGALWVGTDNGLLCLRRGILSESGSPEIPAGVEITALAEDGRGDVWIGTRFGLLRRGAASGRAVPAASPARE